MKDKHLNYSFVKKPMVVIWLCMLLSSLAYTGYAQDRIVRGTIVDEVGIPVIGATVMVQGTTNGTITDLDGIYSLSARNGDVLQISYVGYQDVTVKIDGKSEINIVIKEDTQLLDEVVVVGYGVQKKTDVTGSLTRVGAKEIEARPVSNAIQALQGKAAGVDITSTERPGELGKIRIRGQRSIDAETGPLYVVDGIPLMSSSAIETLNPRDIESVDILKDASATAIYGSRGANGVILVTTKRGKDGTFSLNYSGTVTLENIVEKSPMMSADEYITWRRWASYNAGKIDNPGNMPDMDMDKIVFARTYNADPTAWSNIMRGWESGTWDGSKVINTDWTDLVTQTAVTHEHTISASGGTDKMQSYISFGYLNQEGTMKGQMYERYTAKTSVDITPVKWFQLGGSIVGTWSNQDYGFSTLQGKSSSGASDVYSGARRIFNYALPYDENSNIIRLPGGDDAVITIMDEWKYSTQQRQIFRALGSFYAQLDFGEIIPVLKGLRYRLNFGPDYRNWREGSYVDTQSSNRNGDPSWARLKNQRDFSWTLDNMITYNNSFRKHTVGATLLHTASAWNIEESSMSGYGIERSAFLWNAFGGLDISDSSNQVYIGSGLTERQLESYMVRLNYGYDNRYLLTVSGRWDGASQLAAGHKWKFFSSAALAWRMDQEDFMKDMDWLEQLKLRVGYGSTGSSAVSPYATLGSIQRLYLPFDSNLLGFTTNEPNYYKTLIGMANNELGWEITKQYNIGIDFSFLRGRIGGSIDVYASKTSDLLLKTNIPTVTGYESILANIGATKNKGFDFTLNTVNIQTRDFTWSTDVSLAYAKDKIVELQNGKTDDISNKRFIGQPVGILFGYAANGLWNEEDAAEMAKFNEKGMGFEYGMVKPVDQNGDYVINDEDRVVIGNTNPLWNFGMMNTFRYKSIELSFMMYGRFKYWVDKGAESQTGRYNQRSVNYWTPENTNAYYQKPIENESGGDSYSGSLGYRKANFLKMRNISIGYTLPRNMIKTVGLSNLKVYAQVQNPFMIASSLDFYDLDVNSTSYNRGFTFGIDISF